MGDEDFFSGFDFDDNTLEELELNAIASTQLQKKWQPPKKLAEDSDEDVIVLDQPPVAHNVALRQGRPSAHLTPNTEAAYASADAELEGEWAKAAHLKGKAPGNQDLEKRIAELEAEQIKLRNSEQEARATALARQGEIAIVRANYEKANKDFERKMDSMRQAHAEELAKHKSQLEASKKEQEKMTINNRFLQHDLEQESHKPKRMPTKVQPRITKRTGTGDGFNDAEVAKSPPKRERRRESPPKQSAKRQRTDSPGAAINVPPSLPLHFSEPEPDPFIPNLLSESTSLEELCTQHLPSDLKGPSLGSILLMFLSAAPSLVQVSRKILTLWTQSLQERYFSPISPLTSLLRTAFSSMTSSVVASLLEDTLPVLTRCINLVAIPLGRAALHPSTGLDLLHISELHDRIPTTSIFTLLLSLCEACVLDNTLQEFWRRLDIHFILLMLTKAQPIEQITTAITLLSNSIIEDESSSTFGPISADETLQAKQESGLIIRLTSLLFEVPIQSTLIPTQAEPSPLQIAKLHYSVLALFHRMCLTRYGRALLKRDPIFLGRVVKFLSTTLNEIYTFSDFESASLHTVLSDGVNLSVKIIYFLLFHEAASAETSVPEEEEQLALDTTRKLSTIHGGYHKFLLSMTRVAFTEDDGFFESEIHDEVSELAHKILDLTLSPEEGEHVASAVATPKASGKHAVRGIVNIDNDEDETMDG
ncbi:hypothetical protein K470DRAFT_257884 [Piedraia hortae CBS 480.64]|uniref:DNA repair protein Rad26 n=1 Tax=Piedraia hortae CBS 480.64 TaxID=1314780 RepID=A0A6A7C0I9_9PEZI|nr:hypothetical protein K470DRAFT_257884 [Piedraia hortae CBS 480.64]